MIVLSFTGSIRKSACVRERSCSWGTVIGQGNMVDKRISHKQKHKFQVKEGEKKGSVPCCTNACCMSPYVYKKNHLTSKSTNAGKSQSSRKVSWNYSPKKWFLLLGHNMWPQAHFWQRSRGRTGLTAMKPNELVSGKLQSGASSQDIRE